MNLVNPQTGNVVHFDDCDDETGTMIEAKGPGYVGLISFPQGEEGVEEDFLDQAGRQVAAAGSRRIEWYFAEQQAADYATKIFAKTKRLGVIHIFVVKARNP